MYDAIVIGAGAGGMSAAARLTAAGKKVLLVESRDRLGGRASSETIEGFTVNLGAISLRRGGVFEETFTILGVPLDVRAPKTTAVFRIKGKLVDVTKGALGVVMAGITKHAARIGAKLMDTPTGDAGTDLPETALSTEEWLGRYTRNATVHAIFRNLCASLFSVNASELPAPAFLTFFGRKGRDNMGFCPRGTIGLWNDLGDGIRRAGGDIWLHATATALHVEDGRITALDIVRDGRVDHVATRCIISNMGPAATAKLDGGAEALGGSYLAEVEKLRPAGMIVLNFATRERLVDTAGLICFGPTRRLCTLVELTATIPEIAPDGWHQYVAYAVPIPALDDFDEQAEIELSMQDLRDEFPGFANAKILSIRVMRDQWPAQRACAGLDMPQETPIPNLWHVGDAVKPFGEGGTGACAESGKRAAAYAVSWLDAATFNTSAALVG